MAFGRKRGAQPKNSNAFKHGVYAGALGERARKVLRHARTMDPHQLAEEIALMRTIIESCVHANKDNVQAITLAAGVLVRMVALDFSLNATEERGLHDSLIRLIRDVATEVPAP